MSLHQWFTSPVGWMRSRYQQTIDRVEADLDDSALNLPQPAPWTLRLTQVILLGLTAGAVWSIVARVDVVVDAKGRLEPISQSQAIQSRVGGVVTAVLVREGEQVDQGQLLMQLDKTAQLNQLKALLPQQEQLVAEIAVLRTARRGGSIDSVANQVKVSPELIHRAQDRMLLVAQLNGNPSGLSAQQRQRYELFQRQIRDRLALNQLAGSSLNTQIAGIDTQINEREYQSQVERELLTQLQPLLSQGAISRTDFLRRTVDVNTLQSQLNQDRLQRRNLQLSQLQAQVEGRQVVAAVYQDLQRQLSELDAEFDNTIQSSQRQLIQVNSQLEQVKADLDQQDLRAPADGVVFDLQAKLPGVVAQPGQELLQVVPNESLIARVQVANADIANIRVGMPVDVRVDAFPFTEFGSIDGVVTKVGSEAVATETQTPGQTVFPVEVRLDQQFLQQQSEQFVLVPGMTLVANIRVRERAPISYVTEELTKAIDRMRAVR
ncbi:HlyD family type I secretion periplasmic adaptor subunit [Microcoleus sp. FACHB-1515]|uniref:HlyD family type I secretion periplasmic adaptor subunit n=1 Tax=Cyanophyceae TaxID=3028117 RepID=UPI0016831783|nr:HlyD family type I secretion periplasmic adaptor subunit [Microcoleus sp. FACHB-1515]MBD2089113.1 HlyD family type I secretion periplasmic adaptor subunit [Microcoleus sp. FACHB-1515]